MSIMCHSRAAGLADSFRLGFVCLIALLVAPQLVSARPQSADAAPPAAQQQAPDPAKKEPAPAPSVAVAAAAAKARAPKTHRVFTNDDFSSSPVAPGANRRLKQLNRCNRTCFVEVEKQALGWGYTAAFPRSTTRDMEDRLATDIEELQNDPKWQRLLLEMISAHIDSCLLRQKAQPSDDSPTETPARGDLQDEEERMKNYRPPPGSNFNTASSAVLAYRFSSKPDPLRASLMVHQYMDEIHRDCPAVLPPSNSQDDSDDP